MNKDKFNLAGKVILSDQLATQLYLNEKESLALQTGSALCDSFLEEMRNPITGQYIDGAEDLAVEKAQKAVPGYGDALTKWANGFKSILTSGKG